MAIPTANRERERLLKLAEEYRDWGYEISIHPNPPETSKEIPISFPPYDDFDWKTHKQQWELFAKASLAKL